MLEANTYIGTPPRARADFVLGKKRNETSEAMRGGEVTSTSWAIYTRALALMVGGGAKYTRRAATGSGPVHTWRAARGGGMPRGDAGAGRDPRRTDRSSRARPLPCGAGRPATRHVDLPCREVVRTSCESWAWRPMRGRHVGRWIDRVGLGSEVCYAGGRGGRAGTCITSLRILLWEGT